MAPHVPSPEPSSTMTTSHSGVTSPRACASRGEKALGARPSSSQRRDDHAELHVGRILAGRAPLLAPSGEIPGQCSRGETPTAEPVTAQGAVAPGVDAGDRCLGAAARGWGPAARPGDGPGGRAADPRGDRPPAVDRVGPPSAMTPSSACGRSRSCPRTRRWSACPRAAPRGCCTSRPITSGPLLFWVLALPSRFLHPSFMPVTVGVVNVACVIGIVAIARRRGGRALMFVVAAGLTLMLASVPADRARGGLEPRRRAAAVHRC